MAILAATDFSNGSEASLKMAARLADIRNERLDVIHCIDLDRYTPYGDFEDVYGESPDELEERARKRLSEQVASLDSVSNSDVKLYVQFSSAADGLIDVGSSNDYSLLAVGAIGQGRVERLLVGSTAEEVVRRSTIPVLITPPDAETDQLEEILIPTDFSECSKKSFQLAIGFAKPSDARLHALHSYILPSDAMAPVGAEPLEDQADRYENFRSERLKDFLDEFQSDLGDLSVSIDWKTTTPDEAILEKVEESDIDLLVMGTRGHSGIKKWIMGSTTQKVLRQIPCPMLTVNCSA